MKTRSITCTRIARVAAATTLSFALAPFAQAATPADPVYDIVDHIKPGLDAGWDYLSFDSKRHRLFVTRGDAVQVIDAASGKLAGTLTGLHGTHGVAFSDRVGFVTNGGSNAVTAFDLDTLQVMETVPVTGKSPDAIVYDPAQNTVYSINHRSGDITAIAAASLTVTATIAAPGTLEFAAVDGKGKLFVNVEDKNTMVVVDTKAGKVVANWKLGACDGPTGLAIDVAHNRLFSTCGNGKMMVLDAATGRIVAELPIGGRSDAAAFDPALDMAYSSNGDGTLTVIHEDDAEHFRVVQIVATQAGARTMTLDPDSHRLYLSSAQYGPAPAPTAAVPHPRPPILPGSFAIIVVAPKTAH